MPFSRLNPEDWEWLKEKCAEWMEAAGQRSADRSRESILASVRERPDLLDMFDAMVADYQRHGESAQILCPESGEAIPGAHMAANTAFTAGSVISDRYLVLSWVGRGAAGEVYEVLDQRATERGSIALKTLRDGTPGRPDTGLRFEREVRNMLTVAHPNVCRIYGAGLHRGQDFDLHYLTMEFLPGQTLARWLRDRDVRANPLVEAEALPLIRQMAAGLAAIHAAGLVHRDFKPANVMLAPHGAAHRVAITDFGLSQAIGEGMEAAGAIGTPGWMAPEQFGPGPLTSAVDVYALGITMCEMLTGARDGSAAGRTLGGRMREVVARCLERDPAGRFADGAAVLRALE